MGEAPDKDGLVTRSRKDKVGVLRGGGDGGDPVRVALEGSAEAKSFGHGCLVGVIVCSKGEVGGEGLPSKEGKKLGDRLSVSRPLKKFSNE